MHLRDITMDDLSLYRELLTDPRTMAELGGPLPEDGLRAKLVNIVDEVRTGTLWYSVIVPDRSDERVGHDDDVPTDAGVGTVCIWRHEDHGEPISEIGWMVLPRFQGRGLASAAVRSILERARADGRWGAIRAFPAVTNGPSNAICRKTGFTIGGERDFEYAGRSLRCNIWVLDPEAGT